MSSMLQLTVWGADFRAGASSRNPEAGTEAECGVQPTGTLLGWFAHSGLGPSTSIINKRNLLQAILKGIFPQLGFLHPR